MNSPLSTKKPSAPLSHSATTTSGSIHSASSKTPTQTGVMKPTSWPQYMATQPATSPFSSRKSRPPPDLTLEYGTPSSYDMQRPQQQACTSNIRLPFFDLPIKTRKYMTGSFSAAGLSSAAHGHSRSTSFAHERFYSATRISCGNAVSASTTNCSAPSLRRHRTRQGNVEETCASHVTSLPAYLPVSVRTNV